MQYETDFSKRLIERSGVYQNFKSNRIFYLLLYLLVNYMRTVICQTINNLERTRQNNTF